jgi:hypothetical protein
MRWISTRLLVVAAGVLLLPSSAAAQGEFAIINFQAAPPYRAVNGSGQSHDLLVVNSPRPKAPGVLWNYTHQTSGGFMNRPFMRYHWWDWDVSGVGHGSDQAGWTAAGSLFRPAGGWPGNGPYYARFRIRVNSPLVPHAPVGGCDGDTQMKYFIWNGYTPEGTDRVILMFHAGSQFGGSDFNETSIQLRAGISGSYTATRFPNREWVHVQIAWRWGQEGSAFQRIYINNNAIGSPTSENLQFNDLDMNGVADSWGSPSGPPRGLDNQFFLGDISNTGSCVAEDAALDVMDFELASQFDPTWFPVSGPRSPTNVRIIREAAATWLFLPFMTLGLVVGVQRLGRSNRGA